MQLLETNGIDIQIPNENEKRNIEVEVDLTGLIKDIIEPKYTKERMEDLIREYLEFYIYEIRDAKLCEILHKEISWFMNEYSDTFNNVQVFFTNNNTLWIRVEMWKDFETWEHYMTHLLSKEHMKPVYNTISFYLDHKVNNTSNGWPSR